jgi:uncharacterized caspase-like protein
MQAMPIRIFLVLFILALIYPSSLIAIKQKASPPEIKRESPAPPEILKSNASQRESTEVMSGLIAAPEQRTALVIGNSAYSSGPLKNPVNDAADMAAMLKKLGFSVTLKQNIKQQEMDESIREFGRQLKRTRGVGLFFYAGHGIQIGGVNYLLPVNARIEKESDVRFQSVNADMVLAEMENAENGLNVVILDACRDNPYSRSFRNAARGLAIVSNAPAGTFISYSTGANQVARDGEGKNSPYTKALLENMDKPGLSINNVFMRVRSKVKKETGQIPWELSSLEGDFFFVPGTTTKVVEDHPSEKATTDRVEISLPKSSSTDELDEESRKLDQEERKLEKQRIILKPQAFEAKWKDLKAERNRLEEKKQLAMGQRPSVSTAGETGRDGRFIAYNNGTVSDTRTGLMWAAKDNGSNINWASARSYCESYRGGGYSDWRMPTQDELAGLYDQGIGYTTLCAASVDKDKVHLTNLINFSCGVAWASETRGTDAAVFYFLNGERYWSPQSIVFSYRALPVRFGK